MKHHADKYLSEANFDTVERLATFASQRGRTMTELAFSWLAAQPFVSSIIPGASTPAQVEENLAAAERRLAPEDLAEIDRLTGG